MIFISLKWTLFSTFPDAAGDTAVDSGESHPPSMEVESGASLDSGYPQSMEMESCEQRLVYMYRKVATKKRPPQHQRLGLFAVVDPPIAPINH